jgi:hypothetical protein
MIGVVMQAWFLSMAVMVLIPSGATVPSVLMLVFVFVRRSAWDNRVVHHGTWARKWMGVKTFGCSREGDETKWQQTTEAKAGASTAANGNRHSKWMVRTPW